MKKCKRVLMLMMCFILLFQPVLPVSATESAAESEDEEGENGEDHEAGEQDTDGEDTSAGQEEWEDDFGEDEELAAFINEAKEELKKVTDQEVVMALVYLCDTYKVRETPGESESYCAGSYGDNRPDHWR